MSAARSCPSPRKSIPLIKTGGLADVAGALPGALAAEGVAVRYAGAGLSGGAGRAGRREPVHGYRRPVRRPGAAAAGGRAGLDLFVLDAPHLYDRPGNPYVGPDGRDWPDNAPRFAALGSRRRRDRPRRAAGLSCPTSCTRTTGRRDWRRPICTMAARRGPGTVMTVHNLAFQGQFPAGSAGELRPAAGARSPIDGVEYYGAIGFLKAGLQLRRPDHHGHPDLCRRDPHALPAAWGSTACCAARGAALSGILNGIDDAVWDPATRPASRRDATTPHDWAPRAANKAALQAALRPGVDPDGAAVRRGQPADLAEGHRPAARALPALLAAGGQLAVLGTGEPALEAALAAAAAPSRPGRLRVSATTRRWRI